MLVLGILVSVNCYAIEYSKFSDTVIKSTVTQYITNNYPLIEKLEHPWTRLDVISWLQKNNLEVPVKSACVFCPYHDNKTWQEVKEGEDWQRALGVDEIIRNRIPDYACYLTKDRLPLEDCNFDRRRGASMSQLECTGMCFL